MKRHGRKAGFTLIELLICVAIILVISAIAIPKLLSAYAASQESAGAGSLRTVNTALASFQIKWGTFPAALSNLGGTCNATTPATATAACLMDDVQAKALAVGPVSGYAFTYTQTNSGASFTLNADPATGSRASRHYYSDDGLVIHFNDKQAAAITDPTL
jgi:prepilin-type N-terminal cleavage/methylation domain-containing protein